MDEHFTLRLMERLGEAWVRYFDAELHGGERIPKEGGVMIVSNHAFLAIDSGPLMTLIYRESGRMGRGLAEKLLYSPTARRVGVTRWLRKVGAVKGTRDNAVRLLRSGELVMCYPGGAPESLKGPDRRYELRWERARGFIEVASRAGVPILPIVATGIDEAYPSIGKERFFARNVLGKKRYDLPLVLSLLGLPFPVKFDYHVGELFHPPGPEELKEPERLALEHRKLWHSTQALLDEHTKGSPSAAARWSLPTSLLARVGILLKGAPSGVVEPGVKRVESEGPRVSSLEDELPKTREVMEVAARG